MKKALLLLMGRTAKNSFITVGANVAYGLLIMLFFALASRALGPEKFGLVSIALAVFAISFDILSLGTTQALVRFVSIALGKNQTKKAHQFAGAIFKLRLLEALLLIGLGIFFGRILSLTIYDNQALLLPLTITIIASGGILFSDFFISLLQAYERFLHSALVMLAVAILKIVFLIFLLITNTANILYTTIAFVITPLLGSIFGASITSLSFIRTKITTKITKPLFTFSKWMALWGVTASLAGRVDILLLGKLASSYETGIYSAASKLAMGYIMIGSSFASVLVPKVSRIVSSKTEMKRLYKLIWQTVSVLILSAFVFAFIAKWIVPFVFGRDFVQSTLVFQSLTVGIIFFLGSIPSNVSLLALGYSKWIGTLSFLQLAIVLSIGWLLIPDFGAQGAAIALILAYFSTFIFSTIYAFKKIFS